MNIFRYLFRFLRWRRWMRIPFYILGFICLLIAIWIGLPMTGVEFLASVWFRATVTGVIFGISIHKRRGNDASYKKENNSVHDPFSHEN